MDDLKSAFRQLLKNPDFSAVAVLTLVLGMSGSRTAHGHPGVGIVRDAAGNMYWTDRGAKGGATVRKRSPGDVVTTVLQSGALHDVRFMTCSPNSTIHLIDRSDLIQISRDGSVTRVSGPGKSARDNRERPGR